MHPRGLGYEGGALVFTAGLAAVAALYHWTSVSRVTLFWVAFILTRPLGATVGDLLDKPISEGGLNLSRPLASAVIAAIVVVLLIVLPQRPGQHPGGTSGLRTGRAKSFDISHDPQTTGAAALGHDAALRHGDESPDDNP
jgi:hypothetical protein